MFCLVLSPLLMLLIAQDPTLAVSLTDTVEIDVFKDRCEAVLSSLSSYRFEDRQAVEMGGLTFESSFRILAANDGRMNLTVSSPLFAINYVTDGSRTMIRMPREGTYVIADAARDTSATTSLVALPSLFGRMPEFGMVLQGIVPPLAKGRFVRADTVVTPAGGGEAWQAWSLVPGSAVPAKEGTGDVIGVTLAVDGAGIIRRCVTTHLFGSDTRVQITNVVEKFEADSFGAEDFAIGAPAQGREVKRLEDLFLGRDLKSRPAPAFTLPSSSGGSGCLNNEPGTLTLIDFWATWCLPCRRQLEAVEELAAKDSRVRIVLISKEPLAVTGKYLGEHNPSLHTLCDETGRVHEAYGVRHLPTTVLLDENGVIREQTVGFHSCAELMAMLARAREGD